MRRKYFLGLSLFALLSCFLYVSFNLIEVKAPDGLPVHNINTGIDYATIQEAISAAETLDGHTILVDSGIYYEHVTINKSVSLLDENEGTPIIDGGGTGTAITITVNTVVVSGFIIKNSKIGIYLNWSSYNVIHENNITNNSWGDVLLDSSSNNNLSANNITNSWLGIVLRHSNNNSMTENSITNNYHGVLFSDSSNNTLVGNNMVANEGKSISFNSASNNTIVGNTMVGSNQDGIYFAFSSYNVVAENNVLDNACGIYLSESANNSIYHNNFVSKVYDVHIYNAHGYTVNVWDNGYPSGGNYYSDYAGNDKYGGSANEETGSDGIGDQPYLIEGDTQDKYPLMGIYSSFNATLTYNVQIISNSSISGFHYNGSAISFKVSGKNGTSGFCRICVPTALMNDTFKVFVNGTKVAYNLLSCSNSTHSYLYFTYNHSTQDVIIIPEFPYFLVLTIFMIGIPLAIIVHIRNRSAMLSHRVRFHQAVRR